MTKGQAHFTIMNPTTFFPGRKSCLSAVLLAMAWWSFGTTSHAADFNVTTPGSFFQFNATSNNPTLTLVRGRAYTFALSTLGSHPFFIGTSLGSGVAPPGVSGNNGQSSGTITFAVPANATNCVYYCPNHFFGGTIVMTNPPAPPTIKIVKLTVGTNLTVTSTMASTNGLTLTPQFNTNLSTTNWTALTVQSNKFLNGTNEIICGRPAANPVFLRIRAQQN